MSHYPWREIPLGQILCERQEVPSATDLTSGTVKIISKIRFADGRMEFRATGETKTGMILIRPGDLVLSGINATKGAIALYGDDEPMNVAATIHYSSYAIDRSQVAPRFLHYFLRHEAFRAILARAVPQGMKTELKASRFLAVSVPLPSLSEQYRILVRVETILAHIYEADQLRRESVKQTTALLAAIIAGVLSPYQVNGTLKDILSGKPRNGWSPQCDDSEAGVPVLTLSAVTGFNYRQNKFKRTSLPTSNNAHYWLSEGDLLLTRSNSIELVGHTAIYNGQPNPCIYSDLMMRLAVDPAKARVQFVHYWLQSTTVRSYVRRVATGTSPTMKKLSQNLVMDIPFPKALTIEQQDTVIKYLSEVQATIEKVINEQRRLDVELSALKFSVLAKAFRGEL